MPVSPIPSTKSDSPGGLCFLPTCTQRENDWHARRQSYSCYAAIQTLLTHSLCAASSLNAEKTVCGIDLMLCDAMRFCNKCPANNVVARLAGSARCCAWAPGPQSSTALRGRGGTPSTSFWCACQADLPLHACSAESVPAKYIEARIYIKASLLADELLKFCC